MNALPSSLDHATKVKLSRKSPFIQPSTEGSRGRIINSFIFPPVASYNYTHLKMNYQVLEEVVDTPTCHASLHTTRTVHWVPW